jgi:hypothetical protein
MSRSTSIFPPNSLSGGNFKPKSGGFTSNRTSNPAQLPSAVRDCPVRVARTLMGRVLPAIVNSPSSPNESADAVDPERDVVVSTNSGFLLVFKNADPM